MSKGTNQQLAVSHQQAKAGLRPESNANYVPGSSPLLNPDRRVLIAALPAAIPCTVMHSRTSVTTLPLVESGLIIVGKGIGRWGKTAASRGSARAPHCSFQGGICIQ